MLFLSLIMLVVVFVVILLTCQSLNEADAEVTALERSLVRQQSEYRWLLSELVISRGITIIDDDSSPLKDFTMQPYQKIGYMGEYPVVVSLPYVYAEKNEILYSSVKVFVKFDRDWEYCYVDAIDLMVSYQGHCWDLEYLLDEGYLSPSDDFCYFCEEEIFEEAIEEEVYEELDYPEF